MAEKKFSVILAAGGSGTRFGGAVNKVYLPLCGQTVIGVSLDKLLHHPLVAEVIVVYRKEDEAVLMPILAEKGAGSGIPLLAVSGGDTRRDSVKKGLDLASSERVLVHDAARPFWDEAWIDELSAVLDEVPGASVAVLSPDTVKLADERGRVISTTERSRTWLVQTPQAFDRDILLRAHLILPDSEPVTDDCSMLEKLGYAVQLIPGSPKNRKITVPEDLEVSGSCQ